MPEERIFPSEISDTDDEVRDESFYDFPRDEAPELSSHECESPDPAELKLSKKLALLDFRCKVEDAILSNYILGKNKGKLVSDQRECIRDITLWGVPLLPSKGHEGTDVVLMKFLRAKDFKVSDAFKMLRRTLRWRREYEADGICEEELGSSVEQMASVSGEDRAGRPVCYINLGASIVDEVHRHHHRQPHALGTENKQKDFLRRRVQVMEKGIKELPFKPGGVETILQIVDLKNSHGPGIDKRSAMIFQENYPEFIETNIYVNVPFWYFVSHALHSQIKHQKNHCKLVFARPGKVTETLLKYIAPENIPTKYGGLRRENDDEFTTCDKVSMVVARANGPMIIEIPMREEGVTLVWDVTVVGFEVGIKEEFIPDDDCSYNVLIHEEKRMRESIRKSFYIYEPGKIVITVENASGRKRRVFYRHRSKPTLPAYLTSKS